MQTRSWPVPTLKHVIRLTDDCGIIQHAKFWLPHYATGYCADDNSRALIAAFRYYQLFGDDASDAHELMVRYLAFLFYVQRRDGKIRNFIDYTRAFLEEEGSPDSLGRTIWALGHIATRDEVHLAIPAREMFHRALPHLNADTPPHAQAYGILGLCAYGEREELRDEARRLVRPLASTLYRRYIETHTDEWDWFLDALTYANGRMSEALLRAGHLLESDDLIAAGLRSLDFLNRATTRDGIHMPVGCHGWYPSDGECARFDQQPIDAGASAEANLAAYTLTREEAYLEESIRAMDWFYGANVHRLPVFDEDSGGCHDGLNAQGVNQNQGAESTIVYVMAQLQLYATVPELFMPVLAGEEVRELGEERMEEES